jgi:hypothetical protein
LYLVSIVSTLLSFVYAVLSFLLSREY